jgi:hypothetical protein
MHLWRDMRELCRGDVPALSAWLVEDSGKLPVCAVLLVLGAAAYGATIGLWRDALQSVFVAIKFPLLILLTTIGTAMLNGMLAQLMGTGLSFRNSALLSLMSFAIFAIIVGSLAPIAVFLLLNIPPADSAQARTGEYVLILVNVLIIAFAGVVANLRLYALLRHIVGQASLAARTLFTWLAVNLFLGAQLSWNLRPFFGTHDMPVVFLRPDMFDGNFYEAMYRVIYRLFT